MKKFRATSNINLNAPIDAEEVGAVLATLGNFTPSDILHLAKPTSHPLHKYFEWNDSIAARQYRLQQARNLVLAIEIESDNGDSVRAFESVSIDGSKSYVPMDAIAQDQNLVDQVLKQILNELLYWRAKHQKYAKFFGGVFEAINDAERKVGINVQGKKGESRKRGRRTKVRRAKDKKANRKHNDHRGFAVAR